MGDDETTRHDTSGEPQASDDEQAPAREEPPATEPEQPRDAEAAESGDADAGGAEGGSLTDEERAELYKQQLKELRLLDIARDMMLTVVTVGYQKLGLTDETRELRDLDDAHLAIELLRAVIGAVEPVADTEEIETYRSTLAQMQLNYARVAGD
jgi:hypothetical protein